MRSPWVTCSGLYYFTSPHLRQGVQQADTLKGDGVLGEVYVELDDESGLSGRRRVQEKQVGKGKMIYPLNELREGRIQSPKLSRILQKNKK